MKQDHNKLEYWSDNPVRSGKVEVDLSIKISFWKNISKEILRRMNSFWSVTHIGPRIKISAFCLILWKFMKRVMSKSLCTPLSLEKDQKKRYLKEINPKKGNWEENQCRCPIAWGRWLPILLSICNLGVCLHYFSFSFDEPMKVWICLERAFPF